MIRAAFVRLCASLPVLAAVGLGACTKQASGPAVVSPAALPVPMQGYAGAGWEVVGAEHGRIARSDRWSLAGKPERFAGFSPGTNPLFDRAVAAGPDGSALDLSSSSQMVCYAREISSFWASEGGGPSEPIERYIASACGVWGYRPYVVRKLIPDGRPDRVRAELRSALLGLPAAGIFGVAQHTKADQSVELTVAYDPTPFRWDAIELSQAGRSELKLSAKALISASFGDTIVQDGPYGWRDCRTESSDDAGQTSLSCRYDNEQNLILIDASNQLGKKAGQGPLFRIGLFGDGGVSSEFKPGPDWISRVKRPMDDAANLLLAINELRRRAGMPRVNSDIQLALRIDEWWRKEDAQEVRAAFFERAGAYHAAGSAQGAWGGQLTIGSFILPRHLNAGEAVAQAIELPQVRSIILTSRTRRLSIRQYEIEGRDAIETVVAAYLK